MKRVHPDLSGRERTEAEARAKKINEAFATLKDPAKRVVYDTELGRNDAAGAGRAAPARAIRPVRQVGPIPAQADPRRPARRRGIVRGLLLILFLAGPVLAAAWHYRDRIRTAPLLTEKGAQARQDARAEAEPPRRPIIEADIIDAIDDAQWVLDYGTAEDAAQYSRGCFGELRTFPTLRLLDRCIAFDFAWKHQLKGTGTADSASYFAAAAMKSRHLGNAGDLPDREEVDEDRLKSLEALTVATLVRVSGRRRSGSGDR